MVTAERRNVNLQEAAVAAIVLSGDALEQRNITSVDDLEFATPSMTIAQNGQSNQMNIRGIGKEDNSGTATSAVAVYRDGVGTISGFANGEPYYDVANIEVLRGPQGTFVGENAAGGAIFVYTRDPEIGGSYDGWIEAGAGNYSEQRLSGALNIPLTDTFAARVAFNHLKHDSYYDAFTDAAGTIKNSTLNDVDYNSWRLGLRWQPSDAWDVIAKFDYNNIDNHGYAFGVVDGYPTGLVPAPTNFSSDPFTVGNNAPDNKARDLIQRGVLQVSYTFDDGLMLRSISGVQDTDSYIRNDDDGSVDQDRRQHIRAKFRIYTQELTLLSPEEDRFRWIAGAYYRKETLDFPKPSRDGFVLTDSVNYIPGVAVDELTIDWHTPRQSAAGYGQVAYDLTESLTLEAGLRYSYFQVNENCVVELPPFGIYWPDYAEYDENVWTGKVALNWQANPDNYFYTFFATGNTTGGVSVLFFNPDFKNQKTSDFEAGWKGTMLDGRLLTQVGGFYYDIKRYQAYFTDAITGRGTYQNLDGTSTIYGLEATGQAVFGNFEIDIGGAWIHSELGDALLFDDVTQMVINPDGNPQPYTPEYTFYAGMQYAFRLPRDMTLTPRVDYAWIDEQTTTPLDRYSNGVAIDQVDSHEQLNLRLELAMQNWAVIGWMKNATDEEYIEAHGGPGYNAYVNPPRTYGVKVNYTF